MPSPFPGMDPFLEDPGLWPDVHHELISETRALLGDRLRPKYYARIEERVYVSDDGDPGRAVIIPDVRIAARPEHEATTLARSEGVAVAEPIVANTVILEEIRESRIEIIDRDGRRVVTVIELLSPTNKIAGARGQISYDQKRLEILGSPTHLVEIDLLRGGLGKIARQTLPPCEYLVHVSRADRRPKGLLWPIRLSQRLPVIPIPLKEADPDAPLDLQAVLATAYERAGYDLSVDYAAEPSPPLAKEWVEWTDQVLKAQGLRAG